MVLVRTATLQDGPAVHKLLTEKFWPEHRLGETGLPYSPQKVAENIRNEILSGVILLAYVGDELVGSLALHPFAPWWTEETILADGWFFVAPEHRRTRAAVALLEAGRDYAKRVGKLMTIGVFNSHDSDRKEMFFERQGFGRIGGWYMYEPEAA